MTDRQKITEADIRRFSAAILKVGLQPIRCIQKIDEVRWEFAAVGGDAGDGKVPGMKDWAGKVWS